MSSTQKKGIACLIVVCLLFAQLIAPGYAQGIEIIPHPGLKLYIDQKDTTQAYEVYDRQNSVETFKSRLKLYDNDAEVQNFTESYRINIYKLGGANAALEYAEPFFTAGTYQISVSDLAEKGINSTSVTLRIVPMPVTEVHFDASGVTVRKVYDGTPNAEHAVVEGVIVLRETNQKVVAEISEKKTFNSHEVVGDPSVPRTATVAVNKLTGEGAENYNLGSAIELTVKGEILKANYTLPGFRTTTFDVKRGEYFPVELAEGYMTNFTMRDLFDESKRANAEFYWDREAERAMITKFDKVDKPAGEYEFYVKLKSILGDSNYNDLVLSQPLKLRVVEDSGAVQPDNGSSNQSNQDATDNPSGGSSQGGSSQGSEAQGSTSTAAVAIQPAVEKSTVTSDNENSTAALVVAPKKAGEAAVVSDAGIDRAIQAAVNEAKKQNTKAALEIKVDTKKNDDQFALSLSKKSVESLAKSGVGTLRVSSAVGTVQLEKKTVAAIAAQAKGENVEIKVVKADAKLGKEQENALRGAQNVKAYDVFVTSGANEITAFRGGTVVVRVPFAIRAGELPNRVKVWHLSDAGAKEQVKSVYDADAKTVTFTTNHLSRYAVAYEPWKNPFGDVAMKAWYFDAVKYVAEKEIMNGTAGDVFSPNAVTTRAMVVTILHRLADAKSLAGGSATDGASVAGHVSADGTPSSEFRVFNDVEDGKYYSEAVKWAATNKIVNGFGDGTFRPTERINREQVVAIVKRFADYQAKLAGAAGEAADSKANANDKTVVGANQKAEASEDSYFEHFVDKNELSSWALEAMKWATANGIITGKNGNKLDPAGATTRAEIAKILMNFLQMAK